jgi:hypothetical protein
LLSSKRRTIGRNDDFGAGTDSRLEIDVVVGQNYFVVVEGKRHGTGGYSLRLDYLNPDGTSPNDEALPTGDIRTAGSVSAAGDASLYRFKSTVSGPMTVGAGSEDLDPILDVFDSAGRLVAHNDNRSGTSTTSQVEFGAVAGNTYFIRIRARDDRAGHFELVIDWLLEQGL